jgi:hypothetical protein
MFLTDLDETVLHIAPLTHTAAMAQPEFRYRSPTSFTYRCDLYGGRDPDQDPHSEEHSIMKLVLVKLGIGLVAALLMWVSIVLVQLTCFFVIDIIFFILRLALEGSVGLMILLIL